MFIPTPFEEKDQDKILSFIKDHSFGIIITTDDQMPAATHAPLLLQKDNDRLLLIGHISNQNPQAAALQNGAKALCVFHGPHSYISASWFDQPDIPTWNYKAVHVYGTVTVLSGDAVTAAMGKMLNRYESSMEAPVRIDELPQTKLKNYIGQSHVFEIEINELQALSRLSQDRDDASYKKVVAQLKQQDDFNALLLAFDMEHRRKGK
jgi:transcriptional regulator